MPTHKGGLYQLNSTMEIVEQTLNTEARDNTKKKAKLVAVHRLDRVVSGILIFSKCKQFSKYFQGLLNENKVQKNYLARVYGKFPELVCLSSFCNIQRLTNSILEKLLFVKNE